MKNCFQNILPNFDWQLRLNFGLLNTMFEAEVKKKKDQFAGKNIWRADAAIAVILLRMEVVTMEFI